MRGQSHVVGVALLVGIALVAIGSLTAGVGSIVESQAGTADTSRVVDSMHGTVRAMDRTGTHRQQISFTEGTLTTTERRLRILKGGTVIETHSVGALVFENDDRRVTLLAGALLRSRAESTWLHTGPQITESKRNGVVVVTAPVLNTDETAVGGSGGVTTTVQIAPTHTKRDLGTGRFAVAIETRTPQPFERYFHRQGATTSRRQFAGDEFTSVVARYSGTRQGYLVVTDLHMEVNDG